MKKTFITEEKIDDLIGKEVVIKPNMLVRGTSIDGQIIDIAELQNAPVRYENENEKDKDTTYLILVKLNSNQAEYHGLEDTTEFEFKVNESLSDVFIE